MHDNNNETTTQSVYNGNKLIVWWMEFKYKERKHYYYLGDVLYATFSFTTITTAQTIIPLF